MERYTPLFHLHISECTRFKRGGKGEIVLLPTLEMEIFGQGNHPSIGDKYIITDGIWHPYKSERIFSLFFGGHEMNYSSLLRGEERNRETLYRFGSVFFCIDEDITTASNYYLPLNFHNTRNSTV